MAHSELVPIVLNRRQYEIAPGPHTGRQILALGGLADGYDLLLLSGEGDPTGGRLILADEVVDIHAGMHFRAIPGNRTFGRTLAPDAPRLALQHAAELEAAIGYPVSVQLAGGQVFFVVERASLPPGTYSVDASDVLMLTDVQYPASAMDMFWLESRVTLRDGSIPAHASSVESYLGRDWRRWSWHRNDIWTPGVDDMLSHWAFVEACWAKEANG